MTVEAQDSSLIQLQTDTSSRRLEQITSLRARGIGDHIDLPQLVVCGDQSTGKSSVLEGITGLPFPRQDGVCTKFATEIIMRHSEEPWSVIATIIPALSRSDSSKSKLQTYSKVLESFDELPTVIAQVGALMQVRGFSGINDGPAFAEDVLRIEVTGETHLHLTVVDLPGLITVPNKEQTDDNMRTVQKLADSYAENPRTIILTVVQASNDIANQGIIQKSKQFDKAGKRTVGIITKPDLINKGTEKRIALLSRNEDTTKLKLGFFLVKNPTPSEIEGGITPEQRQKAENLLDRHIEKELPKIRNEIDILMKEKKRELKMLGDERPTLGHIRIFLSRIAMEFHNITTVALQRNYSETDASFFDEANAEGIPPMRLRALVHSLNSKFSDYMRESGQLRKVVNKTADEESEDFQGFSDPEGSNGPIEVSEVEMRNWVKGIYSRSRGRELPENHLGNVCDKLRHFLKTALGHIIREETVRAEMFGMTDRSLRKRKHHAKDELVKLVEDEKHHPITYNHYFTDNIQNARLESTQKAIKNAMDESNVHDWNGKMHVSHNHVDAERLLSSLQKRVVVDMDNQACTEALAGLQAYYKVSMKTFVDNICKQVIERHLLRGLDSIFCPKLVAGFSDAELEKIGAETPENMLKRKQLYELHESFAVCLYDLTR